MKMSHLQNHDIKPIFTAQITRQQREITIVLTDLKKQIV